MKSNFYPAGALEDVQRTTFTSFLDFARWTAAAMVFVGHLRNPLFLGYGGLETLDKTVTVKVWYFLTGWHAEAVTVFFVLSGFLVGGLACAKASIGRFSSADYAVDRLTRLFVAFLPALMLTALLDSVGSTNFAAVGFWDHTHPMIREKIATAPFLTYMTPTNFAANAAMLQTFFFPAFGSNQPLWTISAEFWFYVVFGIVMTAFAGYARLGRTLAFVLAGAIVVALGWYFWVLLGLWIFGVLAAFVPWRAVERPVTALFLFAAVLVLVRLRQDIFEANALMRIAKDYLIAATFAWLLVSMRNVCSTPFQRSAGLNRFMADFSYSLYLIHFPLMLFLLAALYATGVFPGIASGYRPTEPTGLTLYLGVILMVYFCAWGFSQATERQTAKLRRALKFRTASSRGRNEQF